MDRKQHLVLDLDETLIHSLSTEKAQNLLIEDPIYAENLVAIEVTGNYYVAVKRPFLDEFLRFCFLNYATVSVWTAGTKEYAHAVVNAIFTDVKPHLLYHRGMCRKVNGLYLKPLTLMAEELKCPVTDMIIVDDHEKAKEVNGDLAIKVPRWESPRLDMRDNVLFILMCVWAIETANAPADAENIAERECIATKA